MLLQNLISLPTYPKFCWYATGTTHIFHLVALSEYIPGLELSVCNKNLIFLFLNPNICCGYSKEPSQ